MIKEYISLSFKSYIFHQLKRKYNNTLQYCKITSSCYVFFTTFQNWTWLGSSAFVKIVTRVHIWPRIIILMDTEPKLCPSSWPKISLLYSRLITQNARGFTVCYSKQLSFKKFLSSFSSPSSSIAVVGECYSLESFYRAILIISVGQG